MEVDAGRGAGVMGGAHFEEPADLAQCARALVLQHLVQNCYKNSAIAFAASLPEENSLDAATLEDMDQRARISMLLNDGQIMDGVELADQLIARRAGKFRKEAVRMAFPELYFRLGCQHFVELVRARCPENALKFAQQTLASYGSDSGNMDVLQDITVLLAYEDPERSPNGALMAPEKRELLAADLNIVLYRFCVSRTSSLHSASPPKSPANMGGFEVALRQLEVCGSLSTPPFNLEQALK
jgi:CTLH/CRA C-terminal to LisH motif domain